jgi:hypothetical protein
MSPCQQGPCTNDTLAIPAIDDLPRVAEKAVADSLCTSSSSSPSTHYLTLPSVISSVNNPPVPRHNMSRRPSVDIARLRTHPTPHPNVFPQANLMAPATPANCNGTAVIHPVGPKAAEAFDGHHDTHTCNLPPITQQYLPTTSPRTRTTDGTAVSLYPPMQVPFRRTVMSCCHVTRYPQRTTTSHHRTTLFYWTMMSCPQATTYTHNRQCLHTTIPTRPSRSPSHGDIPSPRRAHTSAANDTTDNISPPYYHVHAYKSPPMSNDASPASCYAHGQQMVLPITTSVHTSCFPLCGNVSSPCHTQISTTGDSLTAVPPCPCM